MKRAITAVLVCALLLGTLTGCIFRSPDELYQLPERSPGYERLTAKIDEVERALEMEFGTTVENAIIYSGDNTSTVQLQDLDDDGKQETAVTFLRIPGAEFPLRIYFFTIQPDGSYEVSCMVEGVGSAIYAVDYVELNGGGKKELVVSWQISSGVYQLGVYSLEGASLPEPDAVNDQFDTSAAVQYPEATELMMTNYSGYSLQDIDQDLNTELAVIRIDREGANSMVEVYGWRSDAFVSMGTARLSAGVTSLSRVRANYVSNSVRALYITGTLMDSGQATDIVVWRNGELVNLTLNPETGVSRETLRGYNSIIPADVNSDATLEMPRPRLIPSFTDGVSADFNLIDWSQYNISGNAEYIATTYHNYEDGWYLEIPENWVDKITIGRNDSVSEERAVIFSHWNGVDEEPTPFLSIYKLTGVNRHIRAARGNRFILSEDDSTIYAATFLDNGWNCGLEENDVLDRFHRILSGWTNE